MTLPKHLIGYGIISLSAVLTAVFVFFGWSSWSARYTASEFHPNSSIGIKYEDGAQKPWRCLDNALRAYTETLSSSRFVDSPAATDVLVNIVPYGGLVHSTSVPNGLVSAEKDVAGRPQMVVVKATGTTEVVQFGFWGKTRTVVHVRQLRLRDTWETDTAGTGTGELRGACGSALLHELAQHVLPVSVGEGLNALHDQPELTVLEREMQRRCTCL